MMFLLKKGADPKSALRSYSEERLLRVPFENLAGASGEAVVKLPVPAQPAWLPFLEPLLGTAGPPLHTTSLSAVVFIRTAGRYFALAFGYGRTMLDPRACEPNFGLRVVLNSVDPDSLRSIDAKTLEDLTVYTRRQLSRGSSITTFGLDLHRDLVKALAGDPRDSTFAKRLAGSLPLVLDADVEIQDVPQKCRDALKLSTKNYYKKRFRWVDHLQLVTDPDARDNLDIRLTQLIDAGDLDGIHLALPEITDPEDFGGFRFSTTPDDQYSDLRWEDYVATFKGSPTLARLKRDQVALYSAETGAFRRWTVYECVVAELMPTTSGPLDVLTGGDWFRVQPSYAKEIAAEIAPFVIDPEPILPSATTGEIEPDYNERACSVLSPSAAALDRQFVSATDSQDNIEFCDILLSGRIVHVKRKSSSSTLSHLFQQGLVSADLLQRDIGFHTRISATLQTLQTKTGFQKNLVNQLKKSPVDPAKFEIVYAIIAPPPKPNRHVLPFFSQVAFARAASELRARGFGVALTRIDVT
jgi:uncharacterized protein (TIGR04141 family)